MTMTMNMNISLCRRKQNVLYENILRLYNIKIQDYKT